MVTVNYALQPHTRTRQPRTGQGPAGPLLLLGPLDCVPVLREDPLVVWLYRKFSFEKLMLATLPLILAGLYITLKVVVEWIASGYGPLSEERLLFFGMLCLANGTQAGAAGYLFSIMALPRRIDPITEGGGEESRQNE